VIAEPLVSILAPSSLEADQYRALRHVVERARRDSGLQIVAVTSPGSGDGKTVTTVNLAASLAQSRHSRTLLIDADLHRSSVAEYLGLDPCCAGLVDGIVNEDYLLARMVRHLEALNLSVLTAGTYQAGAYEVLNSPRFEALLDEARRQYDYVVIDTPPLLPLPDCRLIGRWVDGFLIVVAAHKTPRAALLEAMNLIDRAKVIGTVFNGDDRPLAPYSGYYSYYSPASRRPPEGSWGGRARWWQRQAKSAKNTVTGGQ
jgi:capsular exopolysaccharide synthesis family protein